MLLIPKILLSAAVVIGVCGAAAVPIVLNATKKSDSLGGGKNKVDFPLEKCSPNTYSGLKTVVFGDKDTKNVCWTIKQEQDTELVSETGEEYSELFRNMWQNPRNYWSTATENWNQQCSTGNKWLFGGTELAGVEYLVYCDDSKPEIKNQWIKVEGKSPEEWKLQICSGECFTKTSMNDGWDSLTTTQTKGNWRDIEFYSKN